MVEKVAFINKVALQWTNHSVRQLIWLIKEERMLRVMDDTWLGLEHP